MEAIYHAEGRVSWQGSGYRYEYTLRDHLGNSRVMFADLNADNEVDETEILQQNHYYPFGMNMEGIWPGGTNKYQYNGNEAQSEVDHNVSDFNFRTYDAGIGRFWQVDILADWATDLTPYRFGFNNPVRYADPLGLWEENEDGWTTDNPEEIGDLMKSLEIIGDQGYSIQRGDGLDDEAFRMIPDDLSGVNILHNRNGNPSVSNQRNFPAGPNSEQNIFGYPNPERSPAIESVDDPFTFVAGGVAKSLVKTTVSFAGRFTTMNAAKSGGGLISGGKTFAQFKAARGGTQTLAKISTSTGTQRISTEFHHVFLTQRLQRAYNLPNWIINNRLNVWKLNTVQHSLIDPYRYKFLRAGFKLDVGWFGKYNWFTKF